MVLLCGSFVFAQFEDEDSSYEEETTTEEGYSYGQDDDDEAEEASSSKSVAKSADKGVSKVNSDDEEEEDNDDSSVATANASDDQWKGFNYEELGLTQWEFQQAKQQGISRDKLNRLVEVGVRPSEYIQKPWEKLNVTETEWLEQRAGGLEDADIDRSYRNRSGDQQYAYLSLLLPSLYQWKTDKSMIAIWIDALWVSGAGITAYLASSGETYWWYGLLPVAAAHVWSFAHGFFCTQWDSNPDANRFSYGVVPTPSQGIAGFFNVKF